MLRTLSPVDTRKANLKSRRTMTAGLFCNKRTLSDTYDVYDLLENTSTSNAAGWSSPDQTFMS